jgi:hypothetical protein
MLRLVDNLLYPMAPGGCQQVYGLTAGGRVLIAMFFTSYIWS